MGAIAVAASTFSENEAVDDGGALWADGIIAVSHSTFIRNKAVVGGAIWSFETLVGRHLTLVNNSAELAGAAIFVKKEALLTNSLIVGGTSTGSHAKERCGIFNSAVSNITGQYNMVASVIGGALTNDRSCGGTEQVSIGSAAAIKEIVQSVLGRHGGLTQTLALPVGSPAIGKADPTGATSQMLNAPAFPVVTWVDATEDQRGGTRVMAAGDRDLGAYEAGALVSPPFPARDLPNGRVGTAISIVLGASGGVAPYIYAITEGGLPPGLGLNGDVIEGMPMAAGDYTFTITATDNNGQRISATHSITIGKQDASVVPIPLLGPWGLALLAGLLGVIGSRRKWRNT